MRVTGVLLTGVLLLVGAAAGPAGAETPAPERVVVHLTEATSDLHAVVMAFKLASAMQQKGATVTMFLDLEGARLADARQPLNLEWGHGPSIGELYDGFVKGGGKVLVCPHCAMAAGVDPKQLRPGTTIAKDEGEIADLLLAAGRIIDY